MKIKAYGKVNISLDVVGKREDGYHLLSMIMQNIDLYDEIEVEKQKYGITLECNKSYVPVDNRNLAYKAAEIFKERYDIVDGVKINIEKNIPVSAGLAGGSTDAAAVLKSDDPGRVIDILKGSGFDVYSADEAYRANQ